MPAESLYFTTFVVVAFVVFLAALYWAWSRAH